MKHLILGLAASTVMTSAAYAELLDLEKDVLTFGFIKLTDMAPLAIAYEQGYFLDEGLFVTLEAQANWKVLLDGVIDGQLDGGVHDACRPASKNALDPVAADLGTAPSNRL